MEFINLLFQNQAWVIPQKQYMMDFQAVRYVFKTEKSYGGLQNNLYSKSFVSLPLLQAQCPDIQWANFIWQYTHIDNEYGLFYWKVHNFLTSLKGKRQEVEGERIT